MDGQSAPPLLKKAESDATVLLCVAVGRDEKTKRKTGGGIGGSGAAPNPREWAPTMAQISPFQTLN